MTSDDARAADISLVGFMRRAIGVYLRPFWAQYVVIILSVVITLLFDTGLNLSYTPLVDQAIPTRNGRLLALIIGGLVVLFVLSSAGDVWRDYLSAQVGTRLLNDLRLKMFSHLQDLPAQYYARAQTGDILARFSSDLMAIEEALTKTLPNGINAALQLILNTVLLFVLDWRLALVMAVIMPLTFVLPKVLTRRATRASYQRKQDEAAISDTVQEHIGAQAVVRAFGLREFVAAAFARQLDRVSSNMSSASFWQRLVSRTTGMGQGLVYVVVMGLGAYLAFSGSLRVGEFMSFVSILLMVGGAISDLSVFVADLIPSAAGQQRIEELLSEPVKLVERPGAAALPRLSREIRFEQVDFGYTPERLNLQQIDLAIPAGQSVAFVGRSGSGKSTLLNLVMRFYDPGAGRVLLDGCDLREISLASLRSQMGVVFQDTFLFNTTVRENIRLGRPGASDAEIEQAARSSEIHDLIMSLPQGYETVVGERGGRLSGGQRQRLALARAILRAPALLLLDEATSALDPETEAAIHATLRHLARHRTVLSVTHRLSCAVGMDQIVVLDAGKIVERGTHQELLERAGVYSQLWRRQSGFVVSADGRDAQVTASRLRAIPLFEKLGDDLLATLADQFTTEYLEAGQIVFSEGDPGDKFYIVVRGQVSISTVDAVGKVVPLAVMEDGDYFGEIALLEGGTRTATVRTLVPSLFLTLLRGKFARMMQAMPALREAVEQMALERNLRLIASRGRSGSRHRGVSDALDALAL